MTRPADLSTEPLATALVAVTTSDGFAVGSGVLISDRHVLTCAHVVNDALSRHQTADDAPRDPVRVEFVYVDGQADGVVCRWSPPNEDPAGDLALLEIRPESVPAQARPVPLDQVDETAGHKFRVLGFSETNRGLQASGVLVGQIANGWVQMQATKVIGPGVREGFSGAPVWDDRRHGVVGLVVARTLHLEDKSAYMIPTALLNTFLHGDIDGELTTPTVRPLLLDFGRVDETYWLDGVILSDATITGVDADQNAWGIELENSHEVSVEMRELVRGEHRSELVVRTELGSATVRVTADITPCPAASWPRPPSPSEAEEIVAANISGRMFGSRRPMSGSVEIRSLHVVRIVVETVTESITRWPVEVPVEPESRIQSGRLEDLALPTGWAPVAYETPLSRPVRVACHDCDDRHTVPCPACKGRGLRECEHHSESCRMCIGSGLVREGNRPVTMFTSDEVPRFACPRCGGTGAGICSRCGGSGTMKCFECNRGRVPCARCGGTGRRFRYTVGKIEHSLHVDRHMTRSDEGIAFARADAPWRPVEMDLIDANSFVYPGSRDIENWLDEQVGATYSGEIARRVHGEILPLFALDYLQGERQRTLYVMGDRNKITRRPRLSKGSSHRQAWLNGA